MQRKSLLILFSLLFLNNYKVESYGNQDQHHSNVQLNKNNGIKQLNLDFQAENFDYLVKILSNGKHESKQCPIKTVSPTHFSTLKITEALELNKTDLIKCEIINRITERNPILEIHTSSTTSESSEVTKFLNPREGKCFSFRVKAKAIVEIYLYNKLSEKHNNSPVASRRIVITLGSNNNTKSNMRDNFNTCQDCSTSGVSTPDILDPNKFNGFWISWENKKVKVGKEDESHPLFSNNFYLEIGDIQYIGVSTSGNSEHGVWRIMEPFCPSFDEPNKENSFTTKCHKIFDKTVLSSLDITEENKLLKKIEALISEFNTEIPVNVNTIKDYYYKSLDELYLKEYMHLLKKCKDTKCDETTIDMILEKFDEFRKTLQNKLKTLISNVNCPINEHYDDDSEQCICNSGFTKNGNNCVKDTYKSNDNGKTYHNFKPLYGDEILEQSFKPSNKQHETRYRYSTESNEPTTIETTTKNWFSSFDESGENLDEKNQKDNKEILNCATMSTRASAKVKKCSLEINFKIPYNYDETKLEIVFVPNDSKDIYKLTWDNKEYTTFKLNKLKDLTEKADDRVGWLSNALWNEKSSEKFKFEKYRLTIDYSAYYLQIRIDDANGVIVDSIPIYVSELKQGTIINKLCFTTNTLEWLSGGMNTCK